MYSELLKRAVPLGLALIVGSAATLVTVDPVEARSRKSSRQVEKEPEMTLDGRAALAVISIKDQRISLYDADGNAMRGRISSGQVGYETPVGVFSILQKKEEHTSNLYDDASMPFMQRITWSGVALHAGALPGYPASHGCVRLPYSFAQKIFPQTKLGTRVVVSKYDVAPVGFSHPLLLKPEPLSEIAVATPTAYTPGETDETETLFEPHVRKWPAREALLDNLRAEAHEKAQAAQALVEHWETLSADLKQRRKEFALIAKRTKAEKLVNQTKARVANAEKRVDAAKSARSKKKAEKSLEWALKAYDKAQKRFEAVDAEGLAAEKVINELKATIADAETAKTAALALATEAKRKTQPVSVFISSKSQTLYVRQGNEPVFDTKVAVSDPGEPLGTHVFTALDYANEGNDVRWNVISILKRPVRSAEYSDKRKKSVRDYSPPLTDASAAGAALERISIPADVRAKISQYVWPGSSIIVSDEDLSKETGKGTDFIVVASDQPKGSLKIRKKKEPVSVYRDNYYDDDYDYRAERKYRRYYYQQRKPKGLFGWW